MGLRCQWLVCKIVRWKAPHEAVVEAIGLVISDGEPPIRNDRLDILIEPLLAIQSGGGIDCDFT